MRILGDGSKQTTWRNSFSSQSWLNRCRRRWSKLRERRSNLKWWGGERRKHDTQTWNFMFISCNHLEMLPRLLAASDAFICFPSLRRGFGGRHDALMIYLLDLFYVSHRSVKSKNFIVISSSFFLFFIFYPNSRLFHSVLLCWNWKVDGIAPQLASLQLGTAGLSKRRCECSAWSRSTNHSLHLTSVSFFFLFPKPWTQEQKCEEWIQL